MRRDVQDTLPSTLDSRRTSRTVAGAIPRIESTVKEHREQQGWTQEGLARALGVSRQTIVNIEQGDSEPRVLLAIALAATLGVAIDQLFRRRPTV